MRHAQTASCPPRSSSRLVGWLGLGLLVVMIWVGQSASSQARLDPYFVVRGEAFGGINPRVLFVLDSSGSMSRRASSEDARCRWSRCENPAFYESDDPDVQSEVSRMYMARRAVRDVVDSASEAADFAFMSFLQNSPETQDPPARCGINVSGTPISARFVPAEWFRDWANPWERIRKLEPDDPDDFVGGLRLCQGGERRPYAYLRWDELGNGPAVTSNDETGDIPPSPMIAMGQADYLLDDDVLTRRVQFFPEFLGVRVQLNATTDPGHDILDATVGDYDRMSEVWNNDFYYWPYVDGFSGYGRQESDTGVPGTTRAVGIAGNDDFVPGATLHAPFYLDLSETAVPPANWGPADAAASLDVTLAKTAPIIEGGIDAVSNTPWASAVGDIPASPDEDNRAYSHSSVASYLAFIDSVSTATACAPTNVILLTDGDPTPSSEGGALLYERLAALRNELGASVYVVGLFLGGDTLNEMACAGAGACSGSCSSPCNDEPANDWDTCENPANPGSECAFVANSTSELQEALSSIISLALEVEIDSGQPSVVNEFGAAGDDADAIQTTFTASTDYPGWRGHVQRRYCTARDEGGELLASCVPPSPEFDPEIAGAFETNGPCYIGRDWDAGVCLRDTAWNARRIYSHDAANNVFPIANPDGTASNDFRTELELLGHVGGADAQDEANDIVAFLLGRDAPGGWKLPGVSNSAPIVVRRVPEYRDDVLPEVAIRDPHCAGRVYGDLDAGTLPDTLEDFARDAWDEDEAPNYAYQEAVVVGDDFGIIHAFQLDSGNELFGILPRFAIDNAVVQAANGALNMGQPDEDLEDHIFGVASTLNHGWAYDAGDARWRHLGVIGMGAGGYEYITLDLSAMTPPATWDGTPPVEVVWTTESSPDAARFDEILGETWARPALAYHVDEDRINVEPRSFIVAGSGYRQSTGHPDQGQAMFAADAITGELVEDIAVRLPPVSGDVYESTFGALVDPAVASHCISRYWAEAQEVYIADPAGRLFRWDLGRQSEPLTFKHTADSGGVDWSDGVAGEAAQFPACTGTGDTCTVGGSNPGDPFVFGPAVTAFDRIDGLNSGALSEVEENDVFLIALASGSPYEDTLDGGDETNDFHSSLYMLIDNHSGAPGADGFSIPSGAPKSGGVGVGDAVSGQPRYTRIAVSDIERTRVVTPYPGASPFTETRTFSKAARPIRAPRIYVTGVVDDNDGDPFVIEDVEVYYMSFFIYEPGAGECDPRFYDSTANRWYPDRGTTYEITFRVTADATDANGFEFNTGAATGGATAEFEDGFEPGLTLVAVDQQTTGDCESGNCGAVVAPQEFVPCGDSGEDGETTPASSFVIPTASKTLDAFTPIEN